MLSSVEQKSSKYDVQIFINFVDNNLYGKKTTPIVAPLQGNFYITPQVDRSGNISIDAAQLVGLPNGITPDLKVRIYILAHGSDGQNFLSTNNREPITSEKLALFIQEKLFCGRVHQSVENRLTISLLSCNAGRPKKSYFLPELINDSFAAHLLNQLTRLQINVLIHARTSFLSFDVGLMKFNLINRKHAAQYRVLKAQCDEILSKFNTFYQELIQTKLPDIQCKLQSYINEYFTILHQQKPEKPAELLKQELLAIIDTRPRSATDQELLNNIIALLAQFGIKAKEINALFVGYHTSLSKISYFNVGGRQTIVPAYGKENNPFFEPIEALQNIVIYLHSLQGSLAETERRDTVAAISNLLHKCVFVADSIDEVKGVIQEFIFLYSWILPPPVLQQLTAILPNSFFPAVPI